MSTTTFIWILVLPLAGFAVLILAGRRIPRRGDWLATGLIGASLVLSTTLFARMIGGMDSGFSVSESWSWIDLGSFRVSMGFFVDNLTIVMLMVVCIVSFLVHLYSIGYMHGDPKYSRYFAYLGLFSFSMLGVVLCDNLIALYVFWELVGLSSYLLIGFWYEKDSAADAGKKAFLTTRVGDLFMFIGIMMIYSSLGTFDFHEIFQGVARGDIGGTRLTVAGIFLFGGAIGKSAQFPLHVWLPDAMEGPTPVSALIHAATMVAAGVYMVGRLYLVFTADALLFIAYTGLITAMMAATIAIVQTDIKRALAYSTVSQLGYMVAALGVGGFVAGLFHLMTHAFFKALLFLGSGSVIHAVHSQEMPEMGGLRRKMPVTFWTFLAATAAISGIPPLSGFWSKDMILKESFLFGMGNGPHIVIFVLLLLGAGVTAFYMFRIVFLTFLGSPRDEERHHHAHESPWSMALPLAALALLSVLSAWNGGGWFTDLIRKPVLGGMAHGGGHEAAGHGAEHLAHRVAMFGGMAAVGVGILLSWLMYGRRSISAEAMGRRFAPLYTLFRNKYYFDEAYSALIVRPVLALSRAFLRFDLKVIDGAVNGSAFLTRFLSFVVGVFDAKVVDGAANGAADVCRGLGAAIRRGQTGRFQSYAMGLAALSFLLILVRILGRF